MILSKIYRKSFEILSKIASFSRIIHIRLKYPSVKINFGSFISPNCQIACANDSKIILENAYLAPGVIINADMGGEVNIRNSYIGFYSVIIAIDSIMIEDYCEIAEMVVIRDQNHNFGQGKLLRNSGLSSSPIKIEKNVWIGAKASILKGVTLGGDSVIGANSVVTKSVPSRTVFAGIPAKLIKSQVEES